MRIAVVQHVHAGYYSDYISSLLDEASLQLNYQVKTWSNSIPAFKQQIAENAIVYILIESDSSLALKWWYAVKLKSILKKLKPGVVLDLNGIGITAKIAQLTILDQTLFNKNKDVLYAINRMAIDKLQHTINKANGTITYSKKKARALNEEHKLNNRIHAIRFTAPDNFRKYEWHEKIMIKAMQSDNNDYFISVLNDNAEDDFTTLLRGFSIFKKWQQSNMKLLLLPKYEGFDADIHEKLKKYKYRNDVNLLESLDEVSVIAALSSAHSFVHFSSAFADLAALSIALKCALPIISFKDEEVEEYLGDAAYYTENSLPESLGKALINLYKDENLQAQLREAAEKQALNFNRETYRNQLWQLLQTAAHS